MTIWSNWLQRWNFIERARLERQLWEAFERGEDLERLLAQCQAEAEAGQAGAALRLEIWRTTLERIRKLEVLMKNRRPPGPGAG